MAKEKKKRGWLFVILTCFLISALLVTFALFAVKKERDEYGRYNTGIASLDSMRESLSDLKKFNVEKPIVVEPGGVSGN